MSLVTVAIAMHVRCAKCQGTIQLGAVVDRARCPTCGHVEALPPERWRKAMDAAANDGPTLPDETTEIVVDDDEIWLVATKRPPRCASCGAALPARAAENARARSACFCVSCGAKILVRPVPGLLAAAFPGITHLLEEDGAQLKTPDAPIPDPSQVAVVRCAECGGTIQPDGRSRAVRCPYCSVMVVLPQAVWARLHTGENEPHTFYLVHDPSMPRPLLRADVKWSSLDGLCCDASGNLYGIGTEDGFGTIDAPMIFALDPQLRTRWVRKALPLEDDPRIAWRNDGVLFAWSERRYSALLFRAADGQDLGKLGGEQPKGLDRHVLDLSHAESLAIDFDGTVLFSKRDRLARSAPDGTGIETWPPGQGFFASREKLRPFTDEDEEDAPSLEDVGDRPTKLRNVTVRVGWDGRTYLQRGERLVCFDRSGKKLWTATLPDGSNDYDFGVDARGIAYVVRWLEAETHGIYRVLPGGACALFVDGRNPATPIREDRHIAVFPDGRVVLGASTRRLRMFGPDGRLLHRSERSIEEDDEFLREHAQARGRDRVR